MQIKIGTQTSACGYSFYLSCSQTLYFTFEILERPVYENIIRG